jgi:hypothetical protein
MSDHRVTTYALVLLVGGAWQERAAGAVETRKTLCMPRNHGHSVCS